jgi:hypothetical protein
MNPNVVPLVTVLNQDQRMLPLLIHHEIPVVCRRISTGKLKKISFRALHDNNELFWKEGNGDWEFLIQGEHHQTLTDIINDMDSRTRKHYTDRTSIGSADDEYPPNFGERYDVIAAMACEERVELVKDAKLKLDRIILEKPDDRNFIGKALADTTSDAALANRSTIMEAIQMGDEAARKYTQELVDTTRAMVKSSAAIIDTAIFNDEMLNSIMAKSNGTVVQHMTRVFLNGVSFLTYYNRKMRNSSLPNRIRIDFEKRYKAQYLPLLRHLHPDDVTLERVFLTGMQAVSEPQLHTFATGFLIHDIGKAKDIEYHEGEAEYNRDTIVDHVRQGYIAVMHKTNYPREAGLITGYHHEYYGSGSGYGFYRALLSNARQKNPKLNPDYCVSFTMEPLLKFRAYSYFPAKVMEIVDIFDALTDPNRKYRAPLSSEEALKLMQNQFIDEELKIDPIIFDLFASYLQEREGAAA